MDVDAYIELIHQLTGTPVKDSTELDRNLLSAALEDDTRSIDLSQFNELLLIANKDRVERPFFEFFFNPSASDGGCRVLDLDEGVTRFRKTAMLRYGNFIHAYRILSKIADENALKRTIGHYCDEPTQLLAEFKTRLPRVAEITPIAKDETYLLGYLSTGEIVAEKERAKRLLELLSGDPPSWDDLKRLVQDTFDDKQVPPLIHLIHCFVQIGVEKPVDMKAPVEAALNEISALDERAGEVQKQGEQNTDVYLTWDHMDVYFATSMRTKREFEQLHDFVADLMDTNDLEELNLRYFDPTQSFEKNRIDKGLIEALMLKRAACTVYSVQDTDTLGKDSELAVTLAQGKTVVAYAPSIDVDKRIQQLCQGHPQAIRDQWEFVQYVDHNAGAGDPEFADAFEAELDGLLDRLPWRSISDQEKVEEFRTEHESDLKRFCKIIAVLEKNIYDRRAESLKKYHPLAIQVYLDTGVANGVLVVRDIQSCAKLVRQVLTNEMDLTIRYDDEVDAWLLIEKLSGCVYRVVTGDRKLTNCFWNFYRTAER